MIDISINKKYQQRDKIIKRDQIAYLQLKNIITEMKNYWRGSIPDLSEHKNQRT